MFSENVNCFGYMNSTFQFGKFLLDTIMNYGLWDGIRCFPKSLDIAKHYMTL